MTSTPPRKPCDSYDVQHTFFHDPKQQEEEIKRAQAEVSKPLEQRKKEAEEADQQVKAKVEARWKKAAEERKKTSGWYSDSDSDEDSDSDKEYTGTASDSDASNSHSSQYRARRNSQNQLASSNRVRRDAESTVSEAGPSRSTTNRGHPLLLPKTKKKPRMKMEMPPQYSVEAYGDGIPKYYKDSEVKREQELERQKRKRRIAGSVRPKTSGLDERRHVRFDRSEADRPSPCEERVRLEEERRDLKAKQRGRLAAVKDDAEGMMSSLKLSVGRTQKQRRMSNRQKWMRTALKSVFEPAGRHETGRNL